MTRIFGLGNPGLCGLFLGESLFSVPDLVVRNTGPLASTENPFSSVRMGIEDMEIDPERFSVPRACGPDKFVGFPEMGVLLATSFAIEDGVLTRDQLEQGLYGWNEDVESNALEVHIHHLRKKLGSGLIRTVRGVGYSLVGSASN